jgi:hypothetical protein
MLAVEAAGMTPGEVLQLDRLERQMLMRGAVELEKWRWDNWSKIFGR